MAYIGVSPSNGVRRVHTYTATASQTTFSGAGAEGTSLSYKDSNFVDVYQNGIKLGDADYTSTSGTSIVLAQGASVNDLVVVVVFDVFSVADTVSKADGGTFDSAVTFANGVEGGVVFNETSADVDFRVESNGEANMLVVDGGNNAVVIGESAPDTSISGGTPAFQVIGSAFDSFMSLTRRVASASAPVLALTKSRNTSVGSHTIVQNDDTIGEIVFFADDGTDFDSRVATIKAQVDGTPGANDTPGRLVFMTTADGSNSPTERLRIDDSGNVGIGEASPDTPLHITYTKDVGYTIDNFTQEANCGLKLENNSTTANAMSIMQFRTGSGADMFFGIEQQSANAGDFVFGNQNTTDLELMRIKSDGRIGIGDSTPTAGVDIAFDTQQVHCLQLRNSNSSTGGGKYIQFAKANGDFTGSVTQSSDQNTVSFNTSSDYRLKENITDLTDATTRLKQLKPRRFNWIADENNTIIDGFIAHEVSDIVPEAITGVKDGTQDVGTIKDENGNVLDTDAPETRKKDKQTWTKTGTKNVYQGIDQSKLVPLLVKTIQELEARITALENAE